MRGKKKEKGTTNEAGSAQKNSKEVKTPIVPKKVKSAGEPAKND